jgi:hypothetical protein
MRVALILPGLTRSAKICYDSLNKYLLSHYDIDIYIHTWDVSNVSLDASVSEREIEIGELEELYKPKKLVVEKYFDKRPFLIDKYKNYPKLEGTCERSMSMFYKLEECFNLIEDDYDMIIRSRMDIMFHNKVELEKLNNSSINIPLYQSGRETRIIDGIAYSIPHDSYGILDCFSVGNYENMKKYCNVYTNLDKMCLQMGFSYHPEHIQLRNLEIQSASVSRFDLDFSLVRKPNK